MTSSSQIIVTAVIWAMTAAGGFFGIRGALRRRRNRRRESTAKPLNPRPG